MKRRTRKRSPALSRRKFVVGTAANAAAPLLVAFPFLPPLTRVVAPQPGQRLYVTHPGHFRRYMQALFEQRMEEAARCGNARRVKDSG
jgi:hypothetical protein